MVTYMEGITLMEKSRTARLVISGKVNDDLEMALIDVSHELRKRVAKTEFCDVALTVALRHVDEIKALLTTESEE
jgi:hypothetical protein